MACERIDRVNNSEGEESKPPFSRPGETADETVEKDVPQELAAYEREAQTMVDSYQRFFQTFAKDFSLRFKLSDKFFIDLERGEVNLAVQWFAERGFSHGQILWATLHELEHFRDMADDPKGVMGNFDSMRAQVKKTALMILEKWQRQFSASDPEFINTLDKHLPIDPQEPDKGTMNAIEQAAFQIHHTFYSVFDDAYVNNGVARRAPRYEPGTQGGDEVYALYHDKFFPKTDYTELPRHLQFLYKLLREEMVPDETVQICDDVAAALERVIAFQGKEYMAKEIVEHFIMPRGNRDTRAGERYFVLQKTLEPIWSELLRTDLDEWYPLKPLQRPPQRKGKPELGEDSQQGGNPFDSDYQDFEDANPDQFSPENVRDWINKTEYDKKKQEAAQAAKKTEENKTAAEKAKNAQERIDEVWCEKHDVNPEVLKRFREIEAGVTPYLEGLSKLWQRIIFGSMRKMERETAGYFRTGTELDIAEVIRKWPEIQKGDPAEVEVMRKTVSKERLIQCPELIRVRLVGDMSGSMKTEKIHVLQQCFVLLLSSIREFETYLNLTRSQTRTKLEVDTEGWIFGDNAKKVKKLRSESGIEDEQVEIVKIFEHLKSAMGNTYDDKALKRIFEEIQPEERDRIAEEKIMEMVFEITDGGSSDAAAARKAVDDLESINVITRAFQIGETDDNEKAVFNLVWNANREEKLGEIVGKDIQNLVPAIAELLKKYLGNVRL